MLTFANIDQANLPGPTCVTIGNFDGLHRGHQVLLQQMIKIAEQEAEQRQLGTPIQTGIITFEPHPSAVLRPGQPHWLLTTPSERLELAAAQGLDFGIIQEFTPEIAALDAEKFIRLLKQQIGLTTLVVGPDFALGRGRHGNVDFLRELGQQLDYTVHVIEPVDWQGISVRSSHIRTALDAGDIDLAAVMLGRPYCATGRVISGDQRGRLIGIPTANLQTPENKLLPKNGVYATRTELLMNDVRYCFDSVTNLGVRPTVNGVDRRLEVHLLDFPPAGPPFTIPPQIESTADSALKPVMKSAIPPIATADSIQGDIYGQQLTVEFVTRLRDEQRFDGLDALVAQIHADIAQARAIFA